MNFTLSQVITSAFKSLFSVISINILIICSKLKREKIIFFYHPKKLLTSSITPYIEDLFKDYHQKFLIIYGHETKKRLGKNYFFIKQSYFKFLINVEIFISCYLCDKFTRGSKRIYLNHNIYDPPFVSFDVEKKTCERLSLYNIIFLPSQDSIKMLSEMFGRYSNSPKIKLPILKEIGYPKFDFLQKKIIDNAENRKNSVIIAPTNFHSYPDFTLKNNLKELIDELLYKTDLNVILRPHPSNRYDQSILKINNFFKSNVKFSCDFSEDYSLTYSKSICLLTDQSDTAYMFAFLTMRPVIFFSNKNLNNFINSKEEKIRSYNYRNLNYFINRDKIGIIINQVSLVSEKINKLRDELKKYELSISNLKKKIKYLGRSKQRFDEEIKSLIFNSQKK